MRNVRIRPSHMYFLRALARLNEGNGIKYSVGAREALECGGLTPLSNSLIDQGIGKRRQAAALQRLPPILILKPNAIGFMKEAFEMRLGIIVALAAIAMTALIARDCSARRDDAATKVETAGDARAGDEPQSAEFALSAKDELKVRAK